MGQFTSKKVTARTRFEIATWHTHSQSHPSDAVTLNYGTHTHIHTGHTGSLWSRVMLWRPLQAQQPHRAHVRSYDARICVHLQHQTRRTRDTRNLRSGWRRQKREGAVYLYSGSCGRCKVLKRWRSEYHQFMVLGQRKLCWCFDYNIRLHKLIIMRHAHQIPCAQWQHGQISLALLVIVLRERTRKHTYAEKRARVKVACVHIRDVRDSSARKLAQSKWVCMTVFVGFVNDTVKLRLCEPCLSSHSCLLLLRQWATATAAAHMSCAMVCMSILLIIEQILIKSAIPQYPRPKTGQTARLVHST